MSFRTTQDLGNQEISEKFQNFEKLQCRTQSNFVKNQKPLERKLSFSHSALLKKLEFVSNILLLVVDVVIILNLQLFFYFTLFFDT